MKDGLQIIYCSRPGCGKEVGVRRWSNNKVVEQEWIPGHCMEDEITDEGLHITPTRHFCSIECSNKADEFLTPEVIEDE